MANKGLKEENTMLDFEIAGIKVSIDLAKENKNIIASIPLGLDIALMPIKLPLIYNWKNRNEPTMFGKGYRFFPYKKIVSNDGNLYTYNADGSVDEYIFLDSCEDYTEYQNPIDLSIIKVVQYDDANDDYYIYDKSNNMIDYYSYNLDYMRSYIQRGKVKFLFSGLIPSAINISVTNLYNDNLIMIYQNGLITSFEYKEYPQGTLPRTLYNGTILYNNDGYISRITTTRDGIYNVFDVSISYVNGLTIIDNVTNQKLALVLSNNEQTITISQGHINNNNLETTIVNYYDYKTEVVNNYGIKTKYFFDNNYLLQQVIDELNFISSYSYNNLMKLNYKAENIYQKNDSQNIISLPTNPDSSFYITMSYNNVSVTDTDFTNILASMYQNTSAGLIRYTRFVEGLALDSNSLCLWVKRIFGSGNLNVELSLGAKKEYVSIADNKISNDHYQLIYLGVTNYETFNNITIKIEITNDLVIEFGRIEILNYNVKTNYTYQDSMLNKVEAGIDLSYNGYNETNMIDTSYGTNENSSFYEYYSNNLVKKKYMPYGIEEDYEYEGYEVSNHKLKNNNDLIWEESYNYEEHDLVEMVDKYNKITSYEYRNHNVTKITNPLNYERNYTYDGFDEITSIYPDYAYNAINIYRNSNRLLTQVKLPSNCSYNFYYDVYNRLSEVKYLGNILEVYSYGDDNLISSITRGNSTTTIEYDSLKRVLNIKLNNILKYHFTYDNKSRLVSVTNGTNQVLKQYSYDDKENLSRLTQLNGYFVDYLYHQNTLAYKNYTFNGNKLYVENVKLNSSINKNPLNLENYVRQTDNLMGTSFNYGFTLNGKNCHSEPITVMQYNTPFEIKNNIFCLSRIGQTSLIGYQGGEYQTEDTKAIGIALWFNCYNMTNNGHIFTIGNQTNLYGRIFCYLENSKIKFKIRNRYGNFVDLYSYDIAIGTNEWHFVGFSFEYYCNEDNDYEDIFYYYFNFDGEKKRIISNNSSYDIAQIVDAKYWIGYKKDINISDYFIGYITALSISNGRVISEEDLDNYYKFSKEFVIRLDDSDKALNYQAAIEYKKDLLESFDIIPLHSSVISLKGKKPIKSSYIKGNNFINKCLNYNVDTNITAYCPYNELVYDYELGNYGTIMLRFYLDGYKSISYLVYNYSSNGYAISLAVKVNKLYLIIKKDNSLPLEYDTGYTVSLKNWHNVGLTYAKGNSVIDFEIYFDNSTISYSTSFTNNLGTLKTSIGQIKSNGYENYELNGNIEMVAIKPQFISSSDFNTLFNKLAYYSHINKYDKYNHLIVKTVKNRNANILRTTYNYYKDRITKEVINNNNRTYVYNDIGLITSITDSYFGSHTYSYDLLNRLVGEDNMSYAYDRDGNIMMAGITTFTYDNYKRLWKVNNNIITYSSDYMFLPISYLNYQYEYEGKRLKRAYKNLSDERITVESFYDDEGLRIKKIESHYYLEDEFLDEFETYFYYDENKRLVTEIRDGTRYDYLYNGDELYGFVKNLTNRYFYIKDVLNTIIGIIDENQNIVARYDYDAYGNIKTRIDSTGNQILYKGYYFDDYVNLYYLRSRFYNPEWRRFLTPDSIDYLDFHDLNGVNLYAYCNNNPVMYSDGDGTFAILIGIGIGLLTELASDLLDGNGIDHDWLDYLGAGVSGAIGGAVGQAGNVLVRIAGAVGAEIVGGIISENKNYSWDSLRNNVITGLVSAGISEGLSILGKRIARSIYSNGFANASQNGQKQLSKFFKSCGNYEVTNSSALSLIKKLDKFTRTFDMIKKISGNFYGITVGAFGNIIEW